MPRLIIVKQDRETDSILNTMRLSFPTTLTGMSSSIVILLVGRLIIMPVFSIAQNLTTSMLLQEVTSKYAKTNCK